MFIRWLNDIFLDYDDSCSAHSLPGIPLAYLYVAHSFIKNLLCTLFSAEDSTVNTSGRNSCLYGTYIQPKSWGESATSSYTGCQIIVTAKWQVAEKGSWKRTGGSGNNFSGTVRMNSLKGCHLSRFKPWDSRILGGGWGTAWGKALRQECTWQVPVGLEQWMKRWVGGKKDGGLGWGNHVGPLGPVFPFSEMECHCLLFIVMRNANISLSKENNMSV